jgi:hypothetical protein
MGFHMNGAGPRAGPGQDPEQGGGTHVKNNHNQEHNNAVALREYLRRARIKHLA